MSFKVHSYETGAELLGRASRDLTRASCAEHSGTGAVAAVKVRGVWKHVPDSSVSAYERRGEKVKTVYVMGPCPKQKRRR